MVNLRASFDPKHGFWKKAIIWMGRGGIILAAAGVVAGCGSDTKSPPVNPKPSVEKKSGGKNESALLLMESQSNKGPAIGEVFGQVTLDELKDIQAREVKKLNDPNTEVLPGLTLKKFMANQAAASKQLQTPGIEVFPGVTLEQLRAKQQEAARTKIDPQTEVFPGMTRQQLEAKQTEIKKPDPKTVIVPVTPVKESKAKQTEAVPRSNTPPVR
jgi:hypothetical protein